MGTILIFVGVIFIVAGAGLLVADKVKNKSVPEIRDTQAENKRNFEKKISPAEPELAVVGSPEPREDASITKVNESTDCKKPDYKAMGNDFEGYVADILKANGIRLKEWNQGTTSPEGAYAENELNPDFFVSQNSENKPLEYWVECKFRSKVPEAGFTLEEYQLNRYKSIQGSSKRKILIALGVGGSPKSPSKFYIIPLDTLVRFKRIGPKFLPHYNMTVPRNNLKDHVNDWFVNEVFKKNKSKL